MLKLDKYQIICHDQDGSWLENNEKTMFLGNTTIPTTTSKSGCRMSS